MGKDVLSSRPGTQRAFDWANLDKLIVDTCRKSKLLQVLCFLGSPREVKTDGC